MAGSKTVWRVEYWSNYGGKPGCYEVKYYQSTAQLTKNARLSNMKLVSTLPPIPAGGRPYQHWTIVSELQEVSSQMYV